MELGNYTAVTVENHRDVVAALDAYAYAHPDGRYMLTTQWDHDEPLFVRSASGISLNRLVNRFDLLTRLDAPPVTGAYSAYVSLKRNDVILALLMKSGREVLFFLVHNDVLAVAP